MKKHFFNDGPSSTGTYYEAEEANAEIRRLSKALEYIKDCSRFGLGNVVLFGALENLNTIKRKATEALNPEEVSSE